jgi:N6-L-threonylcarbamoyladenine synthase
LGSTQDDSVGECFDKVARLLNLPIEKGGGRMIEEHAKNGNIDQYVFPIPLRKENNFNFSFSGLKSHLLRRVREIECQETSKVVSGKLLNTIVKNDKNPTFLSEEITCNIAASFQHAAISHLLDKCEKAMKHSKEEFKEINTLVVSGIL